MERIRAQELSQLLQVFGRSLQQSRRSSTPNDLLGQLDNATPVRIRMRFPESGGIRIDFLEHNLQRYLTQPKLQPSSFGTLIRIFLLLERPLSLDKYELPICRPAQMPKLFVVSHAFLL